MMDVVITRNPQREGRPGFDRGFRASLRTVGPDDHPRFWWMPQVRYYVSDVKETREQAEKWAADRLAADVAK